MATDASGEDGVGGYAFHADQPDVAFVVAEPWPADIAAALAEGSRARSECTSGADLASMPLAELFGSFAVASAVRRVLPVAAVTAVSDCAPAVAANNAASSSTPAIHTLVSAARQLTP